MPRTVILVEDHTEALLTLLRTSTVPIGDAVIPRNADKSVKVVPFAALYHLIGGEFDGPLSDSQADTSFVYQITSVGKNRSMAQITLDILRVLMMDKSNLIVPNRVVRDIRMVSPFSGVVRDDDLPNPLFYGYDRYEVDTTPA